MPVNYVIHADVVDLTADMPRPTDVFHVDTNVWYWMTYIRASQANQPPRANQVSGYPGYIGKALGAKVSLLRSELSLPELAHSIERTAWEIFKRAPANSTVTRKEFRHNYASERSAVIAEVQSSWGQVKSMSIPIDALADESTADAALVRFARQPLDGYDLFILEAMGRVGLAKVITDDGDYATVPDLQVFTANRRVIQLAAVQGRLAVR